jgi:hypothetical protein
MWAAEGEARWRALSEEVITGMAEWRVQHPRATLSEIPAPQQTPASGRRSSVAPLSDRTGSLCLIPARKRGAHPKEPRRRWG